MSIEHYVPPKQLGEKLSAIGVSKLDYRACLALAHAMRAKGMPVILGHCVRASDAYAFLQANPDWRPFPKKKQSKAA